MGPGVYWDLGNPWTPQMLSRSLDSCEACEAPGVHGGLGNPWTPRKPRRSLDSPPPLPQLGAADAEIIVPSSENRELKRSPFKAWSRSVYSRTCYAYCQGLLPGLFLPFRYIHLHFFQNSRFFLCWLWLTHGSCGGPQNKIGHPAGCMFLR